jgi:hypothetical protein
MKAPSPTRSATRYAPGALLLVALALLSIPAHAQTTITGRILDTGGAPVSHANVRLVVHPDSSVAKAAVADREGSFVLSGLKAGSYRIRVSLLGYRDHVSEVLTLAGDGRLQVGPFLLQQEAFELQGISVQAKKALYQQSGDRMVINLASSPTLSGSSALQVLERSPGVVVDKMSNAVSLIGKSGVRVLVNGKLSYIPAEGLVQYLSGMSADNLEKIELITSPPAYLDAEGNAGYINLVMKRNPDDGLNGSFAASAGYGKGELGNASTSLNYQRGALGIFGNYGFLWNAQQQFGSNYRRVVGAEGITESPTTTLRDPVQRNHDGRVGIEYRMSKSTTLGGLVAAYDNRWSMDALNRLTIKRDGTPVTRIDSDNDEVNHWRHAMGSLNLQQKLGSAGTLRMDLDYLRYSNENPTVYHNTSTDVPSGRTTTEQMESGKSTPFRILVAKADYTRTRDRWELGAGVKGAFARFTNKTRLEGVSGDDWAHEVGFGTTSRLREDVLAAYGSASFTPGEATTLKAGLRYELTDSNLGSDEEKDIVDRRFGSLFPSIALSHKLSDRRQVDASYTRRITRPSFRDMAPFLYFIDPYTFFSGNAGLQPAIINTAKLDVTHGSVLTSLQYAWEDSTIARFQSHLLPGRNIEVLLPTNFRNTQTATALMSVPVHLTSWWSTQNSLTGTWREVEGSRNGAPATFSSKSFRVNSTQTISLPGELTLEGTGFYQGPSLWGSWELDPAWVVNLGLQRTLPNRAKLTLSVSDLFDSAKLSGNVGSPGEPLYIERRWRLSQRSVSLAYSMRFGGGKAAGKRQTASKEESERVQQ